MSNFIASSIYKILTMFEIESNNVAGNMDSY
jgi:hypothetical protein